MYLKCNYFILLYFFLFTASFSVVEGSLRKRKLNGLHTSKHSKKVKVDDAKHKIISDRDAIWNDIFAEIQDGQLFDYRKYFKNDVARLFVEAVQRFHAKCAEEKAAEEKEQKFGARFLDKLLYSSVNSKLAQSITRAEWHQFFTQAAVESFTAAEWSTFMNINCVACEQFVEPSYMPNIALFSRIIWNQSEHVDPAKAICKKTINSLGKKDFDMRKFITAILILDELDDLKDQNLFSEKMEKSTQDILLLALPLNCFDAKLTCLASNQSDIENINHDNQELCKFFKECKWTEINYKYLHSASPLAAAQVTLKCHDVDVRRKLIATLSQDYLNFLQVYVLDSEFEHSLPLEMQDKTNLIVLQEIACLQQATFLEQSEITRFLLEDVSKIVYEYFTTEPVDQAICKSFSHYDHNTIVEAPTTTLSTRLLCGFLSKQKKFKKATRDHPQ